MRIPRSCSFLALALTLLASTIPGHTQSVPCAAITRNPQVLEALLDARSKDVKSDVQDDTINAAQLGRLQFSPVVIQPGDALYLEYRGRDFVINALFASGEKTEFDSSPKGSYDQWRKGILPLDMFRAALNQRLTRLRATAKSPNQVLFRNIKIIRAGQPVFEFAKLASYGRTQLKTAARKELPCKGVDEYPSAEAALTHANLSVPAKTVSEFPLTLTAQEINSMNFDYSPVIQAGDFMVFESNRRDYVFYLLLSNGKEIVSEPLTKADAEDTSVAWRKGRIRLDYPEALNQRIIRQAVVPLHEGRTPLLLRGMKIDGNRELIFELEKSQPGTAKPKPVEPPMSYPSDAHVMTASATTGNMWGRQPETGFLAPKLPTFSMHSMMMFQSTTDTSDPNHFKFNGKELDAETGLYNYGARYYSPALGRFMSPDWSAKPVPIPFANLRDPQTFNLYGYVRNNPTSLSDPDGHAVQLSNDEEKRKQQLAAAQQAVGKQAGKYLYDNVDKNGNHYIGIYSKGPDGKGPDFKDINGASGKLNNIIQDSRIATIVTVSPGTNVLPNLSPNGLIGPTTSGMTPGGSRPISQMGGNEVVYLTSGDPGKLPAALSSTNRDATLTTGDVLSHELGHVFARWFGGDSNASSVQLENQTRRLNGEPTRTGHDEAHDVQPQ